MSVVNINFCVVPMKISEVIWLLENDGWELKRITGSHRQFGYPRKPGLVTVAGRLSATLKPKTEHPEASGPKERP